MAVRDDVDQLIADLSSTDPTLALRVGAVLQRREFNSPNTDVTPDLLGLRSPFEGYQSGPDSTLRVRSRHLVVNGGPVRGGTRYKRFAGHWRPFRSDLRGRWIASLPARTSTPTYDDAGSERASRIC